MFWLWLHIFINMVVQLLSVKCHAFAYNLHLDKSKCDNCFTTYQINFCKQFYQEVQVYNHMEFDIQRTVHRDTIL
jgi:hypothetical protein